MQRREVHSGLTQDVRSRYYAAPIAVQTPRDLEIMHAQNGTIRVVLLGFAGFIALALPTMLGCAPKSRPMRQTNTEPISVETTSKHSTHSSEISQPIVDGLAEAFKPDAKKPAKTAKNVLVLSGGGQYAAYNAGLLVGWSEQGTRPQFDVITGVSSGAIVATYAFMGKKYDPQLQHFFTTISNKDIFQYRPIRELIRNGALANPERLERMIAQGINDEYMNELRQEHAVGRRMYIATMNVATRRVVIWDVGAIACSNRPDSTLLVRKVLLAAGSIPGLFPAVKFDVVIDGKHYNEEHCDGGAASQVFLRTGPGMERPKGVKTDWLKGSNLYAMAAGKLYADPLTEDPGFVKRVTSTISAALYALFRAELMNIYTYCQTSGMKFHMIAIPQDFDSPKNSMTFEPEQMQKMFALGYCEMKTGIRWRKTPPGTEPGEEEEPRTLSAEGVILPQIVGPCVPYAAPLYRVGALSDVISRNFRIRQQFEMPTLMTHPIIPASLILPAK